MSVNDPIQAARIAGNIELLEEFRAGQRVTYRGPVRQLDGKSAVVAPGGDPDRGLRIEFEIPDPRFPEFSGLFINDFTELVPIVG